MNNNMATLLAALLSLNFIVILSVIVVRLVRRKRQKQQEPALSVAAESPSIQAEQAAETEAESEDTGVLGELRMTGPVERAQTRAAIQACTATLRGILDGDYDARAEVAVDLTLPMSDDLNELGYYLNTALEHLTHALSVAQLGQSTGVTVQQSWEVYAQETEVPTGFRYDRSSGISTDDNAWMPSMVAATETREPAQQQGELSVPLALGNEVIGALGLQRDANQPWTSDELLLIQDVADQLTQTIDRLRLVDDVSRSAALEQTTGAVTASIRSEVEIEGVLQRALAELGQALQADSGSVYLSVDRQQETVP